MLKYIIASVFILTLFVQVFGLFYVLLFRFLYGVRLRSIVECLPEVVRETYYMPKIFYVFSPFAIVGYPYNMADLYGIEETEKLNEYPGVLSLKLESKNIKNKYKKGVKLLGVTFILQIVFIFITLLLTLLIE